MYILIVAYALLYLQCIPQNIEYPGRESLGTNSPPYMSRTLSHLEVGSIHASVCISPRLHYMGSRNALSVWVTALRTCYQNQTTALSNLSIE